MWGFGSLDFQDWGGSVLGALPGNVSFNVRNYEQTVYKSISSLRNKKNLAGLKS